VAGVATEADAGVEEAQADDAPTSAGHPDEAQGGLETSIAETRTPPPLSLDDGTDTTSVPPEAQDDAGEEGPAGSPEAEEPGLEETQEIAPATPEPRSRRGQRARQGEGSRGRREAKVADRPPELAATETREPAVETAGMRADTGQVPPLPTREPTGVPIATATTSGAIGDRWSDSATVEPPRRRWLLFAGAGVVGLLAVGLAYAALRPDPAEPAEPETDVRNVEPAPPEGLVALGEAARTEMAQMTAQRDSARAAGVEESSQFVAASALMTEATDALERGGESDLRRAAEAAREATGLFRTARMETGQLRDRAAQAERAAAASREAAYPNRREPGASASFNRGETALAGARRALQQDDYAEATRLFTEADRAFRAARPPAVRYTAADAERQRVLASRERSRAMASAADGSALASAERAYSAAARSARNGDYNAAVSGYQNAARLYAQAARTRTDPRPPPPETAGIPSDVTDLARRVDEARRAASNNTASDAYRQGERTRTAAATAARSGNYANARRLYAGSLSAFQEAGRRTPTQATGVSPVPFIGQYAGELQRAFETENLGALRAFHPYFNRYAGLFDNADNISATVATAPADISGNQATVGVTLSLRYQVDGQPEAPPPVRLRWTLELRGSTWRLIDVASR
jgi:hypothetical protein